MLTGTAESVNTYRYLSFLGSRWRFIAASCAIAMSLALGVSLTRPKLYTATCRILIEPPAGTDIRSALGVSPIYLESLKTYEHFAGSDSLFLRALNQFQLRQRFPDRSVESLKAGILKAGMVRDTKILEIKVTLPDPKTAQALAQYLGEETVKLSRSVDEEGDRELAQAIEKQEADAQGRLEEQPRAPIAARRAGCFRRPGGRSRRQPGARRYSAEATCAGGAGPDCQGRTAGAPHGRTRPRGCGTNRHPGGVHDSGDAVKPGALRSRVSQRAAEDHRSGNRAGAAVGPQHPAPRAGGAVAGAGGTGDLFDSGVELSDPALRCLTGGRTGGSSGDDAAHPDPARERFFKMDRR